MAVALLRPGSHEESLRDTPGMVYMGLSEDPPNMVPKIVGSFSKDPNMRYP